jgi:hypothetical protein
VKPGAVAGLLALVMLAGCAQPALEVGYPPASANRALLGTVGPRRVVVPVVADRRGDPGRIGAQPENGKPIVTARTVPDIVRDALVVELVRNGHEVVTGRGDVVVTADVEEFWLDAVGRSDTTQYVGRVAIAVVIAEGRTGERLLGRRYVGLKRRTGGADSRDAWRQVMDAALARTLHDLATDPDFAQALGRSRL